MQNSGEDRNQLARPSDPEYADLGRITPCQTRNREVGHFWDIASIQIQALATEGLSDDFTVCFDEQALKRLSVVEVCVR